jgi:hypothetical protein
MTALTLLADGLAENNFGDTRSGGLAGPMGLFIIVVLAIGTVLLIRNMNSRLRRLPESFPSTDTEHGEQKGQGPAGATPGTEEPGAEPRPTTTEDRSQP